MQLGPVHLPDRRRRDRLPVEAREHLAARRAELVVEQRLDRVARRRPHVVLQQRQLGRELGRHEVGAGRHHLSELHEHAAALLEREPQPARRRRPLPSRRVAVGAAETDRRPEPVAHRDAGDLRVPTHLATAEPDGPHGMRDGLQPGLRAGDHAGPGEELEPHRGGHRAEQREQEQVAGEVLDALVGLGRDRAPTPPRR